MTEAIVTHVVASTGERLERSEWPGLVTYYQADAPYRQHNPDGPARLWCTPTGLIIERAYYLDGERVSRLPTPEEREAYNELTSQMRAERKKLAARISEIDEEMRRRRDQIEERFRRITMEIVAEIERINQADGLDANGSPVGGEDEADRVTCRQ